MPNKNFPILPNCIEQKPFTKYFRTLDGEPACNVYDMVLRQVEKPMLETVMAQ